MTEKLFLSLFDIESHLDLLRYRPLLIKMETSLVLCPLGDIRDKIMIFFWSLVSKFFLRCQFTQDRDLSLFVFVMDIRKMIMISIVTINSYLAGVLERVH